MTVANLVGLVYRGSSIAKFGDDLRAVCYQRAPISEAEQRIVMERQQYTCALCSDTAPFFQFDHIVPISAGGASHLDNYQALCVADNRLKCEQERHTHGSAWNSRLSRGGVIKAILDAPAPRQLVYGDGKENALELGVVSCRSFALQKAARLPIADILDRIEAYAPAHRGTMDFAFIDASSPNLRDREHYSA